MRIAVRADFTRRSISEKRGSVWAAGWANAAHSGRKRRSNRFTENFQLIQQGTCLFQKNLGRVSDDAEFRAVASRELRKTAENRGSLTALCKERRSAGLPFHRQD